MPKVQRVRERVVTFRMSDREFERLDRLAAKHGPTANISAFIRSTLVIGLDVIENREVHTNLEERLSEILERFEAALERRLSADAVSAS